MKIKSRFLFFLCIACSISLRAQLPLGAYSEFERDSTYRLLADQVNIREQPSVDAPIVTTLHIATLVRILEKSEETYSRNGWQANWYKISWDKGTKSGYVWGGFIASGYVFSQTDKNLLFLYGPYSMKMKDDYQAVTVQVRVVKNSAEIAHKEFAAIGSANTYSGIGSLGDKKVEGVKEVVDIEFSDSFCGGAFGDAILFWDGTQLHFAKSLHDGADGGYFVDESLTYPGDKNGKPGIIIFKYKEGHYDEASQKEIIESSRRIVYSWDGTRLVKQQ